MNSEGEFVQIHRTLDGCKIWWHTPKSIQTEFQRFWLSHSEEIDGGVLSQSNTYVISLNRINIAFSLVSAFTTIGMNLLNRFVQVYDVVQLNDNKIRIVMGDRSKAIRLIRALTPLVVLFAGMLRLLPKSVLHSMGRKIFALFLIRPKRIKRQADDIVHCYETISVGRD